MQRTFLARQTGLKLCRRSVSRRFVVKVSFPASSTFRNQNSFPLHRQFVFRSCSQITHNGAARNAKYKIRSIAPIAKHGTSVLSVFGCKNLCRTESSKRAEIVHRLKINASAIATPSSSRPQRHFCLGKTNGTLAATSRFYANSNLVNQHV